MTNINANPYAYPERVDNADLPANYESAKRALADLTRMDECKDWSDKAMALASYARQAKDETLLKMSQRIQGRAVRRMGMLLEEIERPEKGGRPRKNRDGAVPVSRKSAAEAAGLSERQRKTALRVAKIPDDEFEDAIESDDPPTVSKLAYPKPDPLERKMRSIIGDAAMDDPEAYRFGIGLRARIKELAESIHEAPKMSRVLLTMKEEERAELYESIHTLTKELNRIAIYRLGDKI